ncbi:Hypothetical protein PHPALM_7775 [Phytophthora palmivora]|uniref:Gag protein n=1 Tax=Phytophthora palmivora TaxID=4796 RepID=A0A2P4YBI3_9STRA|nr:Hypothetical protein PHPALM_7775 [Phytophthora palmivora]
MRERTGSPNAAATQVVRADCPHLSDPEWEALQRLSTVIGEAAVAAAFLPANYEYRQRSRFLAWK